MTRDFYLTLLSNSSIKYFPENKTTSFCTQLPKSIHLDGEWSVALTEIQYPGSIINVSNDDVGIYFKYNLNMKSMPERSFRDDRLKHWIENMLKSGQYKSLQEIIANKSKISEKVEILYKDKILPGNYGSVEDILTILNSNKSLQF